RGRGVIVSVRGSVVDGWFPPPLPGIHTELRTGENGRVIVEVVSHPDPETVRGIALNPTAGLARGMPVVATGHPLQVPVGEVLLGRVLNVFGETIDGGEPPAA